MWSHPLIYAQSEVADSCEKALDDGVLLVLKRFPLLLAEEEVELHGKTGGSGFQLPHHIHHVGIDERMGGKELVCPQAEQGEVDLVAHYLFFGEISALYDGIANVPVNDTYAAEIKIYAAHDPSSVTFLHWFPVLERVIDKSLGRDGHYGIVEIAHLDGSERYLLHRAVDARLVNGNPVAFVYHVVACEPYSGNKSGDGVLEHKHEYCRCRTQSGKQCQRVAVYEYRHYDYHREEHHHNLQNSAERVQILVMGRALVNIKHFQ